jgi:hypothetical protein
MLKFFGGLIIIIIGFLIVAKSEWMLNNFGRIEFFETKIGPGGTRTGYKLIGMIVIFFGMLIMTGQIEGFMGWALSPLIKYSQPLAQ